MGKKLFTSMCVLLFVLGVFVKADAEEVVFVVNNYGHSVPSHPPFSTVTMLRGSDLEILGNLMLSGLPDAHSAVLTKDWRQLWVTCPNAEKIAVIDVRNFEVIDTIGFDPYVMEPMGIAVTPDGKYAYVALSNISYMAKIDTETREFVDLPFYIASGARPTFITFNPDGSRAYIVDSGNAKVFVVQTSSDYVIRILPFEGYALQDAVVSPDGGRVYVANMDRDRIEVIRTSDETALSPIPTTVIKPRGIGISPDGAYLFVSHYDPVSPTSKVTMIRLSDNATVSSANMAQNGRRLAVRRDGSRIFVTDHNIDECYAFDVVGETLVPGPVADVDIVEEPGYTVNASPIGVKIGWRPPPCDTVMPSIFFLLED